MDDHVIVAARDNGAATLTKALGVEVIRPIPAEELPQLPGVDWSAFNSLGARMYKITRLARALDDPAAEERQFKALQAAAERDQTAA